MVQEYSMLHDMRNKIEEQVIDVPEMKAVLNERYASYAYNPNMGFVYNDRLSSVTLTFYPAKGYNALGAIDVTFDFDPNGVVTTDIESVIKTLSLHAMNATELKDATKDDSDYVE